MQEVTESRYNFVFGESWEVIYPHFDSTEEYRDKCLQIQGTKAVDTVAIRGKSLYFFEMKNYQGSWLESKVYGDYSTASSFTYTLAQELAQKLRDTIACQVFIGRAKNDSKISQLLVTPDTRIKYVLFLEGEISFIKGRLDLLTIINHEINRHIKNLLHWAKVDLFLINADSYNETLFDIQISPTSGGSAKSKTSQDNVNSVNQKPRNRYTKFHYRGRRRR